MDRIILNTENAKAQGPVGEEANDQQPYTIIQIGLS